MSGYVWSAKTYKEEKLTFYKQNQMVFYYLKINKKYKNAPQQTFSAQLTIFTPIWEVQFVVVSCLTSKLHFAQIISSNMCFRKFHIVLLIFAFLHKIKYIKIAIWALLFGIKRSTLFLLLSTRPIGISIA